MEVAEWIKLLSGAGLPGALLVALWTLNRGDWLPRRGHDRIVTEIVAGKDAVIGELRTQLATEERRGNEWKQLVYEGRSLLDAAVTTAKESKT